MTPMEKPEEVMIEAASLERCESFINSQLWPDEKAGSSAEDRVRRAVTISRQAGCGALVIADKLAHYLQERSPKDAHPWTVFDSNLMDKVLEDHNLPKYLAKFLPEDRVSELQEILDELFGVHPPQRTVVHQTTETILKLAELGNVILIGRGGSVITAKLPHVLHVRLVAPLDGRVEYAHQSYNMSKAAARKFCLNEDLGRKRYLKKYFNADVDDPLLYHMIVNTGLVNYDEAARLMGDAVLNLKSVA
jgi:cytidylate kinase